MLEWTIRYNIKTGRVVEFRDWLSANDAGLREHVAPGWTYIGTLFSVRGFGDYDCETRYGVASYEALGSGFGGDEGQRLLRELYVEFIDWSTRPQVSLFRSAGEVQIPRGM